MKNGKDANQEKIVRTIEEYRKEFQRQIEEILPVRIEDIPNIDLYMDQVTTFMEQKLASSSRDPQNDKILTKTMINNYAKSGLLISPVKKKYSREHMINLLMIYYLKYFLTTQDIGQILQPMKDAKAGTMSEIYEVLLDEIGDEIGHMKKESDRIFASAADSFASSGENDKKELQKLDLICRLSADIYLKKLFIERLLDEEKEQ